MSRIDAIDILDAMTAKRLPATAEVVKSAIADLGGAEGLAAEMVKDYRAAPPGSAQRVRMQQMFLDALKVANLAPATDDAFEDDDPEERVALAAELLMEMSVRDRQRVLEMAGLDQ